MPVAVSRWLTHIVACPLRMKPVDVRKCYRCPFFIKRDGDFVYCRYEVSREVGSPVSVISTNPVIVESSDGHTYQVAFVQGNPDTHLEIKRIQ